jgi:hypothetical protein
MVSAQVGRGAFPVDWRIVIIKTLWGFILGGVGGLLGGVALALMTPPQDATLLWTAFSGMLSAALAGGVVEALREMLRQNKVVGP